MQPPLACGLLHSTKKIWEVINLHKKSENKKTEIDLHLLQFSNQSKCLQNAHVENDSKNLYMHPQIICLILFICHPNMYITFLHFIIIQTTPSNMQQLKDNMDNFFLVMMGCIILFMQVCFLYLVFFEIFLKHRNDIFSRD